MTGRMKWEMASKRRLRGTNWLDERGWMKNDPAAKWLDRRAIMKPPQTRKPNKAQGRKR